MTQEKVRSTNRRLQHNASSDSDEEVRRRKRLTELGAQRKEKSDDDRPDKAQAVEPTPVPGINH